MPSRRISREWSHTKFCIQSNFHTIKLSPNYRTPLKLPSSNNIKVMNKGMVGISRHCEVGKVSEFLAQEPTVLTL